MTKTTLIKPVEGKRQRSFDAMLENLGKGKRSMSEIVLDLHDLLAYGFPDVEFDMTFEPRVSVNDPKTTP